MWSGGEQGAGTARCVRRKGGQQELGVEYLLWGGFTANISLGSSGGEQEEDVDGSFVSSWPGFLRNSLNPFLLPGKHRGQSSRY